MCLVASQTPILKKKKKSLQMSHCLARDFALEVKVRIQFFSSTIAHSKCIIVIIRTVCYLLLVSDKAFGPRIGDT